VSTTLRPSAEKNPRRATRERAQRGAALIEFTLALPLLLVLVFGVMDFGHLVEQRMILTNVSREGGSLASREEPLDPNLLAVLAATGQPLQLDGADGRIIVTKLKAGTSIAAPTPTISTQVQIGNLPMASSISEKAMNAGLTSAIYQHLVFNAANNTADISQVTVVEVFYKYHPVTPLSYFLGGMLTKDGGGLNLSSRAVY
jgi:Flp pilus assembly protein TadG